jgi:hypothetical protein
VSFHLGLALKESFDVLMDLDGSLSIVSGRCTGNLSILCCEKNFVIARSLITFASFEELGGCG